MKLFIKHILRSIKKSPIQPLIILMTLTISVAMFITSVRITFNIYKENIHHKNLDTYICDLTVKPALGNEMRIIFEDEIENIVGENGKILGEFNLTALINANDNSNIARIHAADLVRADNFYGFRFVEYGKITEENLNRSIIISVGNAKKYDVGIGDTLPLYFLNYRYDMVVQGIALPDGVLKHCEGLINIGAVVDTLAEHNPSLAAGMGNIVPYTEIKVQINDKDKIDEFATLLSDNLDNKTVIKESENNGVTDFANLLAMTIISITMLIVLTIAAIVIATGLDLLSKKRIQESLLFVISGAERKHLNRILYLECLIYGFSCALLGELLSLPFFNIINSIFEWNTDDIVFKPYDILIALIASPLIVFITAKFHVRKTSSAPLSESITKRFNINAKYISYKKLCLISSVTVLLMVVSYLVAPQHRFLSGLSAMLIFIMLIYFSLPYIITAFSSAILKLIKQFRRIPPKLMLALTNIKLSYSLKHTARLIIVLLTLLFTIVPCLATLTSQCEIIEDCINCDYVSIGSDKKAGGAIEELDEVKKAFRLGILNTLVSDRGAGLLGLSVSDDGANAIHPSIAPKRLPKNNEIAISSGLSIMSECGVGDSITLIYDTKEYVFEVIEVIKTSSNLVFLDINYLGGSNDLLCIQTGGELSEEGYTNLSNALELRGAALVNHNKVFEPLTNRITSFSKLILFVVIIAIFTTSFGIVNVLVSAHVCRKGEKKIYYTAGMTRKQIFICETIEIIIILLFSAIMIPLLSLVTTHFVDLSVNSFGVDLFY